MLNRCQRNQIEQRAVGPAGAGKNKLAEAMVSRTARRIGWLDGNAAARRSTRKRGRAGLTELNLYNFKYLAMN